MHWLAAFPKLLLYWVKRAFRATSALRQWITSAGSNCWNFTFLYASTWRFFRVNFHFLCWNTVSNWAHTHIEPCTNVNILCCVTYKSVRIHRSHRHYLPTFYSGNCSGLKHSTKDFSLALRWNEYRAIFHIFIQYPNQDCLKWNDLGQFIRLCAAPSGATNSFRHLFPLYVVTLPDKTWCVEPAGFISPLKKRVQG